jgi:hypothetical protein
MPSGVLFRRSDDGPVSRRPLALPVLIVDGMHLFATDNPLSLRG